MPAGDGFFSKIFSVLTGAEHEKEKMQKEDLMYELVIAEGEEKGKIIQLGYDTVEIGRKLPEDKRIDSVLIKDSQGKIATLQARLSWDNDRQIHVIDFVAGTKNPTVVDGVVIGRPTCLKEGSEIIIGHNTMIYRKKNPFIVDYKTVHYKEEIQPVMMDYRTEEQEEIHSVLPSEEALSPSDEEADYDEEIDITKYKTGYILKIISGLEEGKEIELDRFLISIGKLTAQERKGWILLDSSSVSVDQATLKWIGKDKTFAILHGKSAVTPTIVNKIETSSENFRLLAEGDIIQIGNVRMMYVNKYGKTSHDIPEEDEKEDIIEEVSEEKEENSAAKESHNEEDDEDDEDDEDEKTVIRRHKAAHSFKVTGGPDSGNEFVINDIAENKLVIGRKGDTRKDIELSDSSLSEYAASLTCEEGWLCINLENETENLVVNDMPVVKKGLEPGDMIKIGNTLMEYNFLGNPDLLKSPSLQVIEGFDKGKTFHLNKKINLIGRKSKKTIDVKEIELSAKDKSISRLHARLEKKQNKFYLMNEKKENKTFLNGVQVIASRPLMDGDKIKLGDEVLLLYRHVFPPLLERIIKFNLIIRKVTGFAELLPYKSKIEKGMSLSAENAIETMEGMVEIVFNNKSIIKVAPFSYVEFIKDGTEHTLKISLAKGKLLCSIINEGICRIGELITDTARVSTEDSEFLLEIEEGMGFSSVLTVIKGKVRFYNEFGNISVTEENMCEVNFDLPPLELRNLSEEEKFLLSCSRRYAPSELKKITGEEIFEKAKWSDF
ncbi:MAG: FHA domain-containing protein [Candidatus Eremiobacterota bacterium]